MKTLPGVAPGVAEAAAFRAPWWLRSAHLQTLWPALLRSGPHPALERERLELPDGDFLDLDWRARERTAPLVLVLHGLAGSSRSPYARGMLEALAGRGWNAAVMHFRGCSGEPNRLDRSYHSGETGDLDRVIETLARRRYPALACVGYSLGANVLLKWLGERGAGAPLAAAAAVSVPFVLACAAERLERGLSRLYRWYLLRDLRRDLRRKFSDRNAPIDLEAACTARSFRDFDERVTAPLHGFAGAEDYYARSSCRPYLAAIRCPTLIVQAADDPFLEPSAIPGADELPAAVRLEVSRHGGHAGFVTGPLPWRPRYWLEERIPAFLAEHL